MARKKRNRSRPLYTDEEVEIITKQQIESKIHKDKIKVEIYLSEKLIVRPEVRAGMIAFARGKKIYFATREEWDKIFSNY